MKLSIPETTSTSITNCTSIFISVTKYLSRFFIQTAKDTRGDYMNIRFPFEPFDKDRELLGGGGPGDGGHPE
ncbi:MAG: hypothetical protein PVF58_01920 [Candidatus Methanofastidiosia archaeon]|jgi:hypothetical protein